MARWVRQVTRLKIVDVQGRASVLLNHHLSRLNHSGDGMAFCELEFIGAAARGGAFDEIVTDAYDRMSHDFAQLNFVYFSTQFVSGWD
jgi:hypothetical protein